MNKFKLYRNCPICNSIDIKNIDTFEMSLIKNHPMQGNYNLVQCNNCSFFYSNTNCSQKILDDYYTNLSKYEDKLISTGGGYTQYDKDRLLVTARFIADNFEDKDFNILDLGCANGGLLKALAEAGFKNICGVDPSKVCVEITKKEVGCKCYHYSLFDISTALIGKFDLIIISHVWEHILDLNGAMLILNDILNEDGFVYMECPNAMNYKNIIHAPLQEFNTEHINHFCSSAFKNIFGLNNFNTIKIENKVMKLASGENYDAIYGLFQKKSGFKNEYSLIKDTEISKSIEIYISDSKKELNKINNKISELIFQKKAIVFFGIGQLAFKLLANKNLVNYIPLQLFDNNTLNEGKEINGLKIVSGKEMIDFYKQNPFVIIITSLIFEDEIRNNIEKMFAKENLYIPEIIGFKNYI